MENEPKTYQNGQGRRKAARAIVYPGSKQAPTSRGSDPSIVGVALARVRPADRSSARRGVRASPLSSAKTVSLKPKQSTSR